MERYYPRFRWFSGNTGEQDRLSFENERLQHLLHCAGHEHRGTKAENERLTSELEQATKGRTIDANEYQVTDAHIENLRLKAELEQLRERLGHHVFLKCQDEIDSVKHSYQLIEQERVRLHAENENYKAENERFREKLSIVRDVLKRVVIEGIDTSTSGGMQVILDGLTILHGSENNG